MRKKTFMAVLVCALFASSIIVTVASAQTTPSVPEFTLKYIDNSYDVPTTQTMDPYTGQNITHVGYHVSNASIQISIKSQPFDASQNYSLYYNIRTKGHFEEDNWTGIYQYWQYTDTYHALAVVGLRSSESVYTVLFYPADYSPDSQIDFQVQADVFNLTQYFVPRNPLASPSNNQAGYYQQESVLIETSDWSNTQTITIPATTTPSSNPTQTPTPSPTPLPTPSVSPIITPSESPTQQPTTEPSPTASPTPIQATGNSNFTLEIIGIVVIAIVAVGLLIYFYRREGMKK